MRGCACQNNSPSDTFIIISIEMGKSSRTHIGTPIRCFTGITISYTHIPKYHSACRFFLPLNFKTTWNLDFLREIALCSRNFQNVQLRLDFVEIWWFYRHSDFTWIHILVSSNGQKNAIFGNFRASEFWF